MININSRNNITNLLPYNSIGCELGVFEGDFSQILLNSGKFNKLYLVDIFSGPASNFNKSYNDASVLENIVKQKFLNHNNVSISKIDSVAFLRSMPNDFLDFIYIDTTHTYETTVLELSEAYRCIKNNGYICGHDYTIEYFPGVVRAVKEFCNLHSCAINIMDEKEQYPSFYLHINK